jgi:hypothetical protein
MSLATVDDELAARLAVNWWRTPYSRGDLMSIAGCRHCQTPIVDYSSAVTTGGGTVLCCRDCLVASQARGQDAIALPDLPSCARCACEILESDSCVERHGHRLCCYNCAVASAHQSHLVAA